MVLVTVAEILVAQVNAEWGGSSVNAGLVLVV